MDWRNTNCENIDFIVAFITNLRLALAGVLLHIIWLFRFAAPVAPLILLAARKLAEAVYSSMVTICFQGKVFLDRSKRILRDRLTLIPIPFQWFVSW